MAGPTARQLLELFYPYLFTQGDPRRPSREQLDAALIAAEPYRPACLGPDKQELAQAHYAAHLLDMAFRNRGLSSGTTGTTTQASVRPTIIEEEQEGDVRIRYATGTLTGNTGAGGAVAVVSGPQNPYDAWYRLARVCAGAIVTRKG